LNFRDERYLPFEGWGVVSEIQLELVSAIETFDRDSIEDVVLQIQYTARDGGKLLADAAKDNLRKALNPGEGRAIVVSLKRDAADFWARRKEGALLDIRQDWLPFPFQLGKYNPTLVKLAVIAEGDPGNAEFDGQRFKFDADHYHELEWKSPPFGKNKKLRFDGETLQDVLLLMRFQCELPK